MSGNFFSKVKVPIKIEMKVVNRNQKIYNRVDNKRIKPLQKSFGHYRKIRHGPKAHYLVRTDSNETYRKGNALW